MFFASTNGVRRVSFRMRRRTAHKSSFGLLLLSASLRSCVSAVSNDHVKRHSDEVPRGEVCKLLQTKRCRAAKENVVSANRDRAQHGHASAVVFKSRERRTRPRG
jgi:hypothetical protein